MADVRQSTIADTSDGKVIFNADSVAGDLWMRLNYRGMHVEPNAQQAERSRKERKTPELILEKLQAAANLSDKTWEQ